MKFIICINDKKKCQSRLWCFHFIKFFIKLNQEYVCVHYNSDKNKTLNKLYDKISTIYNSNDFLLCRPCSNATKLFLNIYSKLDKLFKGLTFPSLSAIKTYDNKSLQYELYTHKGYNIPKTLIAQNNYDIESFMKLNKLTYPLVHKSFSGSASKNVNKINNTKNLHYPCVIQQFISDNDSDIRIITLRNIIYGLKRFNRDNDWRASGSGIVDKTFKIPLECVKTAYQISEDNNYESMAYDFVKDHKTNEWLVLEHSYTFPYEYNFSFISDYYDANDNFTCKQLNKRAQDVIIEQILKIFY